jgi:hypothetical protein
MVSAVTVKITAPRLKDALVKARADYLSWNGHTDILAWILTVSVMALGGEAEQDWFIQQHQILIGYTGIKSEAEFLRVLEGPLHVHNVQHTPLKKIMVNLRRPSNGPSIDKGYDYARSLKRWEMVTIRVRK